MNIQTLIPYIILGIYSLISSDMHCLRIFAAITLYIAAYSIHKHHRDQKEAREALRDLIRKFKNGAEK